MSRSVALLHRTEEDLPAGVVGGGTGLVGPAGEGEVELAGLERHAVEGVDPLPVPGTVGHDLLDRRGERARVVEADVAQRDVGGDRLELDAQPRGVAERAVGVGEGVEERVAGLGGDDLARAGEHVHLEHRLVRESAAEARRLDAEPADRSAEGDRAQLRHDERDAAVGQRHLDEVLVGAHPLHLGDVAVDLDDARRARRRRARGRPRTGRGRGCSCAWPGARGHRRAGRPRTPGAARPPRRGPANPPSCARALTLATHASPSRGGPPQRARASRLSGQREVTERVWMRPAGSPTSTGTPGRPGRRRPGCRGRRRR